MTERGELRLQLEVAVEWTEEVGNDFVCSNVYDSMCEMATAEGMWLLQFLLAERDAVENVVDISVEAQKESIAGAGQCGQLVHRRRRPEDIQEGKVLGSVVGDAIGSVAADDLRKPRGQQAFRR